MDIKRIFYMNSIEKMIYEWNS